MFCERSQSETNDRELIDYLYLSSSSSLHQLPLKNNVIEASSKLSMSSYMLTSWKARIDPGD